MKKDSFPHETKSFINCYATILHRWVDEFINIPVWSIVIAVSVWSCPRDIYKLKRNDLSIPKRTHKASRRIEWDLLIDMRTSRSSSDGRLHSIECNCELFMMHLWQSVTHYAHICVSRYSFNWISLCEFYFNAIQGGIVTNLIYAHSITAW